MMDLFEAIKKRHSYRGEYLPNDIPHDSLKEIINAALLAPSAHNKKTTEYIVVTKKYILVELAKLIPLKSFMSARAVIVCIVNTEGVPENYPFVVQNFSVAIENMLLAITALGYATSWTDDPLFNSDIAEKISKLVCIGKNKKIEVLLPIGVPKTIVSQPAKVAMEELVTFL